METMKRVLGEEHPDTLTCMGNLASTYMDQGRWKEAEELEVQVIKTRKRVLGEEHPSTLTSMANLAWTLRGLQRRRSSSDLMTLCATMSINTLGATQPDTVNRCQWSDAWAAEVKLGLSADPVSNVTVGGTDGS
jgi:hypothetical protein